MSKLDELFKTKAKIEAELRLENENRLRKLEDERRKESLATTAIEQKARDVSMYELVKSAVDEYRSVIGNRINDPEYMLFFYSLLFTAAERHLRPIQEYLVGMTREYDVLHKE